MNGGWGISYEIAFRWMPLDLTDDKSTLVQVMAWCRHATSHYLSQCWPRSMSPFGVTRPQWVNMTTAQQRTIKLASLQWHHNGRDGVSNHQPRDCLLNRLSGRRSKATAKLRVTGLCEGNSPVTGEFPTQRACIAENLSICWRHHVIFAIYSTWCVK